LNTYTEKSAEREKPILIKNFSECENAQDSVILESYPRQCITSEGVRFVEPQKDIEKEEPIFDQDGDTGASCLRAGCSGQLCLDEETAKQISTSCQWKEEYECYQSARCELQSDNSCGWTQSDELQECLNSKRQIEKQFEKSQAQD